MAVCLHVVVLLALDAGKRRRTAASDGTVLRRTTTAKGLRNPAKVQRRRRSGLLSCWVQRKQLGITISDRDQLTPCLVETLLHGLQLRLELLVLDRQPAVSVLQESLQVLYPLVPCQQLALCDTRFLLQGGVLVDQLKNCTASD